MSQHYSNPARENDPHALPDVETFYMHAMPRRFYDRVYVADHCLECEAHGCDACPESGWYYWFCFPGCMPDSDPIGPFDSEDAAIADMQENYSDAI